jgi:hypothetical protein
VKYNREVLEKYRISSLLGDNLIEEAIGLLCKLQDNGGMFIGDFIDGSPLKSYLLVELQYRDLIYRCADSNKMMLSLVGEELLLDLVKARLNG